MSRTRIPDDVKAFIVSCLACYDTPSVVAGRAKEEFGITITRQAIEKYDPEKRAGARLSPRWRKLHAEARERFVTETDRVAISHRTVRLRILERMAHKAEESENYSLAAQLLEQAAKEVGNAYTNKRELTGRHSGAIQHQVRTSPRITSDMTDKEAADAWAEQLRQNPIPS